MSIEIIKPTDRQHWLSLRLQDVTSTEVSALFGLNPYMTKFELWHRKKAQEVVEFEANDRMKWGDRLEPVIAHGVAEDYGWTVHPFKEYMRDTELRAGSSFDFMMFDGEAEGLMEIKKVDSLIFRDKWFFEGDKSSVPTDAPPHIELQVQHQLMLSQHPYARIVALVGGNKAHILKREPDLTIIEKIRKEIADFWQSIEANIEPAPDYEKDIEFLSNLYGYAEPGKFIDSTDEIKQYAVDYVMAMEDEKSAVARKKVAKGKILELIGDAEKVIDEDFSITAGVTGPSFVEAYERKGFRNFRVNWKKKKGNHEE